jgi:hypothetical protein
VEQQLSLRDIAKQFGINGSSVHRHKKHIPKALTTARQAETVAESTSLLSRVERLMLKCEVLCDSATAARNWSGAAAAAREIRGCLELLGKISGELQSNGARVAINIASFANLDIGSLTEQQMNALHDRLMSTMTDEQLDADLAGIALRASIETKAVSEALLFDEETVSGPSNYEACKQATENFRKMDTARERRPVDGTHTGMLRPQIVSECCRRPGIESRGLNYQAESVGLDRGPRLQ